MIGSMGQNWRQIMQMPQQMQMPSGLGFPTRNATGGWQMPMPTMQQLAPTMQQPQAAPVSAPMMGQPVPWHDWNSSFSGW